jgi:hypothetical protein
LSQAPRAHSYLASLLGDAHGTVSPVSPLPANWPGAPEGAASMCWAYAARSNLRHRRAPSARRARACRGQ